MFGLFVYYVLCACFRSNQISGQPLHDRGGPSSQSVRDDYRDSYNGDSVRADYNRAPNYDRYEVIMIVKLPLNQQVSVVLFVCSRTPPKRIECQTFGEDSPWCPVGFKLK